MRYADKRINVFRGELERKLLEPQWRPYGNEELPGDTKQFKGHGDAVLPEYMQRHTELPGVEYIGLQYMYGSCRGTCEPVLPERIHGYTNAQLEYVYVQLECLAGHLYAGADVFGCFLQSQP